MMEPSESILHSARFHSSEVSSSTCVPGEYLLAPLPYLPELCPPQLRPLPRSSWIDDNDSGYGGSTGILDDSTTDTSSDRPLVVKQELPNHTDIITPRQSASEFQSLCISRKSKAYKPRSRSFGKIPKAPKRRFTFVNANITPDEHTRDISFSAFQRKIAAAEPTSTASITVKQLGTLLDGPTPAKEDCIQAPTPTYISHNDQAAREPSTGLHGSSELGSEIQDTAKIGVLGWVDATKDARSFSSVAPPAITNATISTRGSSAAPVRVLSPRETPVSSRPLVLELWKILLEMDEDYDTYESSQAYESTGWFDDDTHSLRTSTNGSGSNGSPNSSATSNSIPIGLAIKNTLSTNKRSREGEGDEDECPNRRPTREQGMFDPDALQDSNHPGQMSCPMLELHDCQGTNPTISELIRSLMNRHRIVICKECCTRLPVSEDEKRPVNVLQKHASEGCERYCIGTSCANNADDSTSFHRRTERCPSWAALTKETRWTFIWRLVNPESSPPDPNFLPGPAFEHSQTRKLCRQQARIRGGEICAQLMRDIEAKERRISTLENDLTKAKNENVQTQQRCDEKIVNLDNIIESLLERLCENGIGLPGSLQKRLQNECPEVMAGILTKELQTMPALPTSAFTTNHGQYPVSEMSSAWGSMSFPPPAMPTIPETWNTAPQQMVGSNPGYYFPDFSDKPSTMSAMYPSNAFIPVSNSISMSPSTMHAQVGRYSTSETPETVQPCE